METQSCKHVQNYYACMKNYQNGWMLWSFTSPCTGRIQNVQLCADETVISSLNISCLEDNALSKFRHLHDLLSLLIAGCVDLSCAIYWKRNGSIIVILHMIRIKTTLWKDPRKICITLSFMKTFWPSPNSTLPATAEILRWLIYNSKMRS